MYHRYGSNPPEVESIIHFLGLNLEPPPNMSHPPLEPGFTSTITRIAVSQICLSVGYTAAQNSALDTITDVAGRYLRAVANSAAASANSSGRTQSNIFDIIIALEDLGSVQGFMGAPYVTSQSLISSSILKEIMRFLFWSDEIPFAQAIPRRICPESSKAGNGMNLRHVPRWLPEIPAIDGIGMGKERRNWEESFGESIVGKESKENRMEKERSGKGKEIGLPEKRGKVKFKMGMGGGGIGNRGGFGMEMRNGVLSRGGIGKRILCQYWNDDDGNEEDENRKRVVKMPRC